MKKLFLYRLFKYSKPAFLLAVIFITIYGVAISKKMSFVIFPYNAMYSVDFYGNNTGETYALKLNEKIIPITGKWYWKKDFLETSLRGFAHYIEDSNRVFMNHYLLYKFPKSSFSQYLETHLTPGVINDKDWVLWYTSFAGYNNKSNDSAVLVKYTYHFSKSGFHLDDSATIWKPRLNAR